jgi:hypothetical protein
MHAFRRLREQEAAARVAAANAPAPTPASEKGDELTAPKRTRRSKESATTLAEN